MTQQRRPARRTGRRGSKPKYVWQAVTFPPTTVGVNTVVPFTAGGSISFTITAGSTMVRMHGMLGIMSNAIAPTGLHDNDWSFGIMVVNDALAGSAISFPDPQIDNADWFFHKFGTFNYVAASSGVTVPGMDVPIDARSKRRWRGEERELLYVFHNHVGSTDGLIVILQTRVLFRIS